MVFFFSFKLYDLYFHSTFVSVRVGGEAEARRFAQSPGAWVPVAFAADYGGHPDAFVLGKEDTPLMLMVTAPVPVCFFFFFS